MKDQNGREIDREFAPHKKDPADKYKVVIVEKEPDYDVTVDPETGRPVVKKTDKD